MFLTACFFRWVSAQTLVFFFISYYRFCCRVAIVLEACAGCHLQASWTCTCISSLSSFFTHRFLGRQCIGVPSQAKMKCPGKLYYPKWVALGRNQGSSFTRRLYRPFPVGIFQNFPYPTTKLCLRFDGLIIHPDHPGARRLRWAMWPACSKDEGISIPVGRSFLQSDESMPDRFRIVYKKMFIVTLKTISRNLTHNSLEKRTHVIIW